MIKWHILAALIFVTLPSLSMADPSPLIREEKTVYMNNKKETWRLEWGQPPVPVCVQPVNAMTCPCDPFSYGEGGALDLSRFQDGRRIERISLTKFFNEGDVVPDSGAVKGVIAGLKKWPIMNGDNDETPITEIKARQPLEAMSFADYNRDGQTTEFVLPVGEEGCGHNYGIVIGLSKQNPHLHAFSTVAHPDKPLILQDYEWAAIRKGKKKTVSQLCGDHGGDQQIEREYHFGKNGEIQVIANIYSCSSDNKRDKLIKSEEE